MPMNTASSAKRIDFIRQMPMSGSILNCMNTIAAMNVSSSAGTSP